MTTKSSRLLLFAGYYFLLSMHHLTSIIILTIELTSGFSFSYTIRQHAAAAPPTRLGTTTPTTTAFQQQHIAISKHSPQLSREYHLFSLKSTPVDNNNDDEPTNSISNSPPSSDDSSPPSNSSSSSSSASTASLRQELRQRVKNIKVKKKIGDAIAKTLDIRLVRSVTPAPQVIGAVLRDSARGAVSEMKPTIDRWTTQSEQQRGGGRGILEQMQRTQMTSSSSSSSQNAESIAYLMDKTRNQMTSAFARADDAIIKAERALSALSEAKRSLALAKDDAFQALLEVEEALLTIPTTTTSPLPAVPAADLEPSDLTDIADLSYDDIDFSLSEMAPPFIGDDQCLVPGVPLVRVEKAPENSRRIFAGIDIMASVDDVWMALTDYARLQDIVPNLVVNEVLELYDAQQPGNATSSSSSNDDDDGSSSSEEDQCRLISRRMKGAKLRQVGGAKVVGINFSARTTLEVREWPHGLPDYAHFNDDVWEGKSRTKRIQETKRLPLQRYRFPRPFAISKLPTRDISMQSVEGDDGEFRLYQGVWRMQPLPGCAPRGSSAMRLTYAVEISPRAYLPVQLVEKRIANDLMNNLEAIRDAVTMTTPV